MAADSNRLLLAFRDHGGELCKVIFRVVSTVVDPTASAVTTLQSAVLALSRAAAFLQSISIPSSTTDTLSTGEYRNDVEDKITWNARDVEGVTHTLRTPGVYNADKIDDSRDIDMTGGGHGALFVASVLANTCTEDGKAFSSVGTGRVTRFKQQKN